MSTPITAARLADTLHMLLHCGKGRLGEAIEQDAQATLDAWDAQHQTVDTLADDPEYAALVNEQMEIGRKITQARQEAAWQRLYGARADTNSTEHSTHPTTIGHREV